MSTGYGKNETATEAECKMSALELPSSSNANKQINGSKEYSAYFKDVSDLNEIDIYLIHHLFSIDDPSGAIQHASKKLLLAGARTGEKPKYKDIKEARDTLNRWLEINK